jgi:protein tyrosine phosphatase (PTP) superfamily phosphohydrolase (DUF442 family)
MIQKRRFAPVEDGFYVGLELNPVDIEDLALAGCRSLVSLDPIKEPARSLTRWAEAAWAQVYGMSYGHVAGDPGALTSEDVDRFLETVARLERPLVIHSIDPDRVAAFASILLAVERGYSAASSWKRIQELGVPVGSTDLYRFAAAELDRRTGQEQTDRRSD